MVLNYLQKKQTGILSRKITDHHEDGPALTVTIKQFNSESGAEIESKVDTFFKKSLEIRKAELEQELYDVKAMLSEFSK